MKPKHGLKLSLALLLILASTQAALAQKKPNIVILATGGTIAGAAASGTQAGYKLSLIHI